LLADIKQGNVAFSIFDGDLMPESTLL